MNKKQNEPINSMNKTDVLGIVSLVMAFTALQIPGLIVGLIGEKNAKNEGRSPRLSRIGWIINLVMLVLFTIVIAIFLFMIPSNRNKGDDATRKADLNYFSKELEKFHDKNGHYPSSLTQITGSNVDALDPDGRPYEYTANPSGCTECEAYKLKTILEFPHNDGSGWKSLYEIKSQHKNPVTPYST